jgi:hypothetical protein
VSAPTIRPERLRTPLRRLDAVLGGPVWWACHLGAMYWLVPRACVLGSVWPLHLASLVLVALCARAALSGVQLIRAGRAADGARGAERDAYLGWLGLTLAVFFGSVVIAEGMPALFLDPCL